MIISVFLIGTINNLIGSLSEVDLQISTQRNIHEEEALHQVNGIIDSLISEVRQDRLNIKTRQLCNVFINLCSGGMVQLIPIKDKFKYNIFLS